jgi:hypothetical protein
MLGDVQTCREKINKFPDKLELSTMALKPSFLFWQKEY